GRLSPAAHRARRWSARANQGVLQVPQEAPWYAFCRGGGGRPWNQPVARTGLAPVWMVRCVLCSRAAGQTVDTVFVRNRPEPPLRVDQGTTRYSSVFVDADESVPHSITAKAVQGAIREAQ